jgi:hypothetical protein
VDDQPDRCMEECAWMNAVRVPARISIIQSQHEQCRVYQLPRSGTADGPANDEESQAAGGTDAQKERGGEGGETGGRITHRAGIELVCVAALQLVLRVPPVLSDVLAKPT